MKIFRFIAQMPKYSRLGPSDSDFLENFQHVSCFPVMKLGLTFLTSTKNYFCCRTKKYLGFWHVDAIVEHFYWISCIFRVLNETKTLMNLQATTCFSMTIFKSASQTKTKNLKRSSNDQFFTFILRLIRRCSRDVE